MARARGGIVTKRIQTFFDERAADWDANQPSEFTERLRPIVAELELSRGQRVLDVGAGTGVLLPMLAREVEPDGFVVAIDVAYNMIRRAKAKQGGMPVAYVQGDITLSPMADQSFDWVICNSCFPHFDDQQQAMRSFMRALRPSGALVICHTQSREAINAFHRQVGGLVGGHELPDDAAMTALVAGADLQLVHLEDREDRYLLIARRPTDVC